MKKQTAGRDRLGDLAPKFAELNDDVLFGKVWSREKELSPQRPQHDNDCRIVFRRTLPTAEEPSGPWKGARHHKGGSS